MARPIKQTSVSNTGIASATNVIAAAASPSTKLTQGFPTGDALLHALSLRLSGNLNLSTSSAGTTVTRGGLVNMRSLFLSTPQHGVIINGLDGQSLHNVRYLARGVRPANSDISANTTGTPTFDYQLDLAFRDRESVRPEDTSLDLFRVSYMELQLNGGGAGDFITGGTYGTETIQVLNLEIHAMIDPGPVDAGSLPIFRPYMDILKIPVNQTQTGFQIVLPYGGRIIEYYMLQQVNGSTFAPLANTVVGANDTDRITFAVGGYDWIHRVEWLALQDRNIQDFRLSAGLPTGIGLLNWAERDATGYMAGEMMGLNSATGATPQTEIDIDVTAVSNGQLWIVTKGRTAIPVDAQRPATAAK